jgi:hypothetical protein
VTGGSSTLSVSGGGLQMSKSFSSQRALGNNSTIMQLEGCPTYPKENCDGLCASAGRSFCHRLLRGDAAEAANSAQVSAGRL